MNIINLPIEVLKFMVLREYYKSLNVKQKEAELVVEIEKNYGAQEGEDGAAEEIPEIKEGIIIYKNFLSASKFIFRFAFRTRNRRT